MGARPRLHRARRPVHGPRLAALARLEPPPAVHDPARPPVHRPGGRPAVPAGRLRLAVLRGLVRGDRAVRRLRASSSAGSLASLPLLLIPPGLFVAGLILELSSAPRRGSWGLLAVLSGAASAYFLAAAMTGATTNLNLTYYILLAVLGPHLHPARVLRGQDGVEPERARGTAEPRPRRLAPPPPAPLSRAHRGPPATAQTPLATLVSRKQQTTKRWEMRRPIVAVAVAALILAAVTIGGLRARRVRQLVRVGDDHAGRGHRRPRRRPGPGHERHVHAGARPAGGGRDHHQRPGEHRRSTRSRRRCRAAVRAARAQPRRDASERPDAERRRDAAERRPQQGSMPDPSQMFSSTLDALVSDGTITSAQETAITKALSSAMQNGGPGGQQSTTQTGTTSSSAPAPRRPTERARGPGDDDAVVARPSPRALAVRRVARRRVAHLTADVSAGSARSSCRPGRRRTPAAGRSPPAGTAAA